MFYDFIMNDVPALCGVLAFLDGFLQVFHREYSVVVLFVVRFKVKGFLLGISFGVSEFVTVF